MRFIFNLSKAKQLQLELFGHKPGGGSGKGKVKAHTRQLKTGQTVFVVQHQRAHKPGQAKPKPKPAPPPKAEAAHQYTYGLTLRPHGFATVPPGGASVGTHPDFKKFGTATYDRPLTAAEQKNFSLIRILTDEQLDGHARRIAAEFAEQGHEYVEGALEMGVDAIEYTVADDPATERVNIPDMGAFTQKVFDHIKAGAKKPPEQPKLTAKTEIPSAPPFDLAKEAAKVAARQPGRQVDRKMSRASVHDAPPGTIVFIPGTGRGWRKDAIGGWHAVKRHWYSREHWKGEGGKARTDAQIANQVKHSAEGQPATYGDPDQYIDPFSHTGIAQERAWEASARRDQRAAEEAMQAKADAAAAAATSPHATNAKLVDASERGKGHKIPSNTLGHLEIHEQLDDDPASVGLDGEEREQYRALYSHIEWTPTTKKRTDRHGVEHEDPDWIGKLYTPKDAATAKQISALLHDMSNGLDDDLENGRSADRRWDTHAMNGLTTLASKMGQAAHDLDAKELAAYATDDKPKREDEPMTAPKTESTVPPTGTAQVTLAKISKAQREMLVRVTEGYTRTGKEEDRKIYEGGWVPHLTGNDTTATWLETRGLVEWENNTRDPETGKWQHTENGEWLFGQEHLTRKHLYPNSSRVRLTEKGKRLVAGESVEIIKPAKGMVSLGDLGPFAASLQAVADDKVSGANYGKSGHRGLYNLEKQGLTKQTWDEESDLPATERSGWELTDLGKRVLTGETVSRIKAPDVEKVATHLQVTGQGRAATHVGTTAKGRHIYTIQQKDGTVRLVTRKSSKPSHRDYGGGKLPSDADLVNINWREDAPVSERFKVTEARRIAQSHIDSNHGSAASTIKLKEAQLAAAKHFNLPDDGWHNLAFKNQGGGDTEWKQASKALLAHDWDKFEGKFEGYDIHADHFSTRLGDAEDNRKALKRAHKALKQFAPHATEK